MDVVVADQTVAFEGWRFEGRTGKLLVQDTTGAWTPVRVSTRALNILAILLERPGALVTRESMIDVAWPDVAVAPNNLTVQMAALRRVLDEGRAGDSCIQTVPGRGYRFVLPVVRAEATPDGTGSASVATSVILPEARTRHCPWWWLSAGLSGVVIALFVVVGLRAGWFVDPPTRPRLSTALLPFDSLGSDPNGSAFAYGITADLTNGLTGDPQTTVASAASADIYKGRPADPRQIGHALGVRYAVYGSVRRVGTTLRVDAQLASAESGRQLWSDQFDETLNDPNAAQQRAVQRLRNGLLDALIQIESARSQREHPVDPDAFDLVIQARAVSLRPPSVEQQRQVLALYERALAANPSYLPALTGGAYFLIEREMAPWQAFADMRRAELLALKAREIAPKAPEPAYVYMYWLKSVGRCPEVVELGRQFIQTAPDQARATHGIYSQLGQCLTQSGYAEEDIALQGAAIEADPSDPWMFWRYISIGRDQLLLGRDSEAIASLGRALGLNPNISSYLNHLLLAAAYARTGQIEAARQALGEANRQWPYFTVRGVNPNYSTSPVYHAQLARFQDALRLAGGRDHADENADFGVASDGALHGVLGRTPTETPGAITVRTADLQRVLADAKPVVIDAMTNWWGSSIPGAVGLKYAGLGGDFSDEAQDRLRLKMRELSEGDLNHPIVAVGYNSERFDGRNLALRLVALGYTHVYWYRGGREAWEANGLPEAISNVQPW
jgi:adenylate cyclase